MPRITEWYKVLMANDIKELQNNVNKLIATGNGWHPIGGIQLVQNMGVFYVQSMEKPFRKPGNGRPKGSLNKPKPVDIMEGTNE